MSVRLSQSADQGSADIPLIEESVEYQSDSVSQPIRGQIQWTISQIQPIRGQIQIHPFKCVADSIVLNFHCERETFWCGRLQRCWRGNGAARRGSGGEHAHREDGPLHTSTWDYEVLESLPPPQFRFKRPVMELQLSRGDGDPQEIRPTGSVENQ